MYQAMLEENDDINLLDFWIRHSGFYPILNKLARRYLGVPATSVPVERLFSEAGELISTKRNSLLLENANMFLCLSS